MRSKTLTSFFTNNQGKTSKKSNGDSNETNDKLNVKSKAKLEGLQKINPPLQNKIPSRQETPFDKSRRLKTSSREQQVIQNLDTERLTHRNSPMITREKMVTTPADIGTKLVQMAIERTRVDLFETDLKRSMLIGENNLRRDVSHHLDAIDFMRRKNVWNEKKKFTPIMISQTDTQITLPDLNRCSSPWELRSLNTIKMSQSQKEFFKTGKTNSQELRTSVNSPASFIELNKESIPSIEGPKKFPNSAMTTLPSGRMEAKILANWVDRQKEIIENERGDSETEKREKLRGFLNLVFKEIVREVKIECNERGELLDKIWKEDQGLWDRIEEYIDKKVSEGERKNELTCERLHNLYKKNQEKNENFIIKLQKENVELKSELQKTKESLDYNIKFHESKMKKLHLYKHALFGMKKKIDSLKDTNERLLFRGPPHDHLRQIATTKTETFIEILKEKAQLDDESDSEILELQENEQLGRELNKVAIISLPEKQKVTWQLDSECQVESDLRDKFIASASAQTDLVLIGNFFDKGFENTKIVKDMITDYHYKKDVEKLAISVEDMQNANAGQTETAAIKKKKSVSFLQEELKAKNPASGNQTKKASIRENQKPFEIDVNSEETKPSTFSKQSPKYEESKPLALMTFNSLPVVDSIEEPDKEEISINTPALKIKENGQSEEEKQLETEKETDQGELENEFAFNNKEFQEKKEENLTTESSEDITTPRGKFESLPTSGEIMITPALETIYEGDEIEAPFTPINPFQSLKINTSGKGSMFIPVSPIADPTMTNRRSYINRGSFSLFAIRNDQQVRTSFSQRNSIISISKLGSESPESHLSLPTRIRSVSLKNRLSSGDLSNTAEIGKLRKSFSRSSGFLPIKQEESFNEPMPSELYFKSEKEAKEGNPSVINNPWRNEFLRVMKIFKAENMKANSLEADLIYKEENLRLEQEVRKQLEMKYSQLNELYEKLLQKYDSVKLIKDQQDSEKVNEMLSDEQLEQPEFQSNEQKLLTIDDSEKPRRSSLGKHPALNQKGMRFDYLSHNKEIAFQLLEKVARNKMKKFTSFLTAKQLIKQINIIYEERESLGLENVLIREQPLYLFAFNCLLSIYGFRKITEQKFLVFLLSLRKHSSIYRVNMFSRFIGLADEKNNFSLDELSKYIEAKNFMTFGSNFGYAITNSDIDQKYYVPYIRALQYSSIFSEKLLNKQKFQELRKEVDSLKEEDPKKKNKAGIIDFDLYMNVLLNALRFAINSMRNYIRIAFSACDFDCNGWVSLDEYLLIVRYVEKREDEEMFEELFAQHADVKQENEFYMSFDRFVVSCVDYSLFTEEKQNAILGVNITYSELKMKFKEISGSWVIDRIHLDQKFPKLDVITKLESDVWLNRVETLEKRIRNLDNHEENDEYWDKIKSVLISHHIVMKEVERFDELQVKFEDEKEDMEEIEFEEDEDEESKTQRSIRHYKTETLFPKNQHRTGQVIDPNISHVLKNSTEI